MSATKQYAEQISEQLGLDGELTEDVLDVAQAMLHEGHADIGAEHRAWVASAPALARAAVRLLNRRDCCGGYRGHPTTRKHHDRDWLPMDRALDLHFRGMRPVGLHTTTVGNRCRWLAFDIDSHGGGGVEANLEAAETIADRLRAQGLAAYIFDSDGRGGFHVWAVLPAIQPSRRVFGLAKRVSRNLKVKVETFPKQPVIREGGYGNWIRLPGRHYKRDHWSRVWLGDRWGTVEETIGALLEMLYAGE